MSATENLAVRVIATGGLAAAIATISTTIDTVDRLLTLKGLRAIYLKNSEAVS